GLPRRDADEAIAPDLLAAFHRFEQEAGAEAVHQLEVDADRRLQIGGKLAIDRDEVSRPARQSAEGVQVGPVEAGLPGAAARPALGCNGPCPSQSASIATCGRSRIAASISSCGCSKSCSCPFR